jgi:hypothetical protein
MALRASSLMAGSVHVATVGPDGAGSCRRAHGRQGRCAPPQAVARRRAIRDRRCARRRGLAQEGWSPGRTEGCGLPTSASHVLYRIREAEAPFGSRRTPSVSEVSVPSIAIIRILLRSTLPSSIILCANSIPWTPKPSLARKTCNHAWRCEQTINHRNS